MAGTDIGCAAEEDEGRLNGKTSKCCEEDIFGRRMCAEKTLRYFGWMKVNAKPATRTKPQKSTPGWYEVRRENPEAFRKWEQKARTSKKEWKWQRGIVTHPLIDANGTGPLQ